MYYLKLICTFFRIGILNEMAYRVNFYVQLLQSLLSLGTAIAGLAIVFSHTDTLSGWQAVDILALLGIFMFVGGVIGMVINPSMSQLMDDVRRGIFDYTLTKPCDAQFLASISQIRLWRLTDMLLGSGVLIAALLYKGLDIGLRETLAFVFVLCTGGSIIYSFWLMLATLTFWFLRIENILNIFQSMYEAGRWPIGIYPHWLRYILTFLVPVAFAITLPAEALSGRLTSESMITSALLCAFLLAFSRWFWKRGLKNYSGASA